MIGFKLGFSVKLRILQVPACKMEPPSGIISCKNPTHTPTHPPTHPPPMLERPESCAVSPTDQILSNYPNRKWNYPNRKWNYLNRKWNYFTNFQTSDQKTYFTKCLSFSPRSSEFIIQTGNGIISPYSRPLIKKLLFLLHFLQISTKERKWNYPNRKWNHCS